MNNESRQTGLVRLAHLREVTEAHAEEMQFERRRFERLADPASATRAVSSFNLFQTPEPLAMRLAKTGKPCGRVLEPSAGLGRLYRAARAICESHITLVELSPECCGELYRTIEGDADAVLIQADFMACDAHRLGGMFDVVLMNPPFKQGQDIRHISHARELLAPGGRVVSLCANGPRQRAKLMPEASEWIDLPAGIFKSEGTNVVAAIAVFTN